MSLLMEALRKAEEAKRLAAHNTRDDSTTEGQRPSLNLVADDNLGKLENRPANEKVQDLQVESNLDIPFDFQIDESFGASIKSPIENEQNSNDKIGDSHEQAAIEKPSITFTLDERDNIAAEQRAADTKPASTPNLKSTLLVDEAPKITVKPTDSAEKKASDKLAEESRRRESARAVFRAKSKQKPIRKQPTFLIAVSVLALFLLAGGAYLLLNELGVLGRGNQYNIPAATMLVDRTFDNVAEDTDSASVQVIQPDINSSNAIVLIGAESIEAAIESVVTAISPQLPPTIIPEVNQEAPEREASLTNMEAGAIAAAEEMLPTDTELARTTAPTISEPNTPVEPLAPKPISVVRSDSSTQINPRLVQAFDAFNVNDYLAARALYQQALREMPNSRDAMLGLAAVGLRVGDTVTARETYLRLLQLNPRDVLARVGLLETIPARDPVAQESELKSLFEAHPNVAHLAFSLGNLYASQRRWNEAQQSYYDALLSAKSADNGAISPDYAFNLAVSLERLNQVESAYSFYREALLQSRVATPSFDPQTLRERLDALERLMP